MECRMDDSFSTTGIEQIDAEQRRELISAAMQNQTDSLETWMSNMDGKKLVSLVFSFLFFIAFAGSIIYFVATERPLIGVTIFGSAFVVLPLISLFYPQSESQRKGIFMCLATGLGIVVPCLLKQFVKGYEDINILLILVIAEFGFWGLILLFSAFSKFGLAGRSYKEKVVGNCIGYQYFFSVDNHNTADTVHGTHRELVAAPVYTYNYEGQNFTQYDREGGSSFTTVKVGELRELYVDPTDPRFFKEKITKVSRVFLAVLGVALIAVSLFCWRFADRGEGVKEDYREDVKIVKEDGKIVLTQELLMSDNRANIDYDFSVLQTIKTAAMVVAAGALISIVFAVSFYLKGKKQEDISDKAISNRLFLILGGGFVFLLSIGFIYMANGSIRLEQEKYDSPVYVTKEMIVEKTTSRGTGDNDSTVFRLKTDKGDIYEVSQVAYDEVKYQDYYYIARTEVGDSICGVYYCEDYVAEK